MQAKRVIPAIGPHSLGKLIEWKPCARLRARRSSPPRPHSLGKLIEWKRRHISTISLALTRPHSLGKLIEWKLESRRAANVPAEVSPLAGETN